MEAEQQPGASEPAGPGTVLWRPDAGKIEASLMSRYIHWLNQRGEGPFDPEDYQALHRWSITDLAGFWQSVWDFCGLRCAQPATQVFTDTDMASVRWFPGMTLNFADNLLRMAEDAQREAEAVVAYSETRAVLRRTYSQLRADVGALEAFLRSRGVATGDRVAAIVTNGYESLVGMLAATSMGATWSSASPDFGPGAILDRFGQIEPTALIVVNGYGYAGKQFPRQQAFAEVADALSSLRCVVSIAQLPDQAHVAGERVTSWEDALAAGAGQAPSLVPLPADHPVYILYSSGTTGKPKCIVHGAAGLLVNHAKELMLHGDVQPGDRFLYFTTCGWMMWNWQASALLTGATLITVDGAPGYPDMGSLWRLVAEEAITHFGTSARFIAGCRKAGLKPDADLDLSALRVVFSTGSPLIPEDFDWFYEDAGPDVLLGSIAGGTDICACFVGSAPLLPVRRGEIQCRMLGVDAVAYDDQGHALDQQAGELVCRQPLPSMPVGFWADPDGSRYRQAYFERFPGVWAHGDFVRFTATGGAIIYGRSDATLNPGGVRIGTAEIYRQVETDPGVRDSLVVGRRIDGDVEIVLLIVPAGDPANRPAEAFADLSASLRQRIRSGASPRHLPRHIVEVPDIPYTRSGKKVELAIARLLNGDAAQGNRDALANPEALDAIRERLAAAGLLP